MSTELANGYTARQRATAARLAGQLTENTGRHFLDSGVVMGYGYERVSGMTGDDMLNAPPTVIDDYGGVTLNSVAVLVEHLEVTDDSETLTGLFRDYVAATPPGDAYYNTLGTVEEWLESIGVDDYDSDNTYNLETFLDGVFLYVAFRYNGRLYIALSTHNGADVRGGYSDFVVYAGCEDWLWAALEARLFCRMCNTPFTVRIGDGVWSGDGEPFDDLGERGACPKCKWRELIGDGVMGCTE